MNFLACGAIALGFTAWEYCSAICYTRNASAAIDQLQKKILACPNCQNMNQCVLEAVMKGENDDEDDQAMHEESNDEEGHVVQSALETVSIPGCPPCPRRQCKLGRIANNSFFNFLREQRPLNCGGRQSVFVAREAKIWNKMSQQDKDKFKKKAVLSRVRRDN